MVVRFEDIFLENDIFYIICTSLEEREELISSLRKFGLKQFGSDFDFDTAPILCIYSQIKQYLTVICKDYRDGKIYNNKNIIFNSLKQKVKQFTSVDTLDFGTFKGHTINNMKNSPSGRNYLIWMAREAGFKFSLQVIGYIGDVININKRAYGKIYEPQDFDIKDFNA